MKDSTPPAPPVGCTRVPLGPWLLSVFSGTAYGVLTRLIASSSAAREHPDAHVLFFGVMTLSFLFVVPVVIGFLAVRPFAKPSWLGAALAGWLPAILSVAVLWCTGFEGSICVTMALPVMLLMSSIGGLAARAIPRRLSNRVTLPALALPFLVWFVERRIEIPTSFHTVQSQVTIAAAPERIWGEIERVRAITPEEIEPSFATRLGFPRPVEATLDREGVGGIRHATFEGGLLFLETITTWDEPRVLSFAIVADTASIPPTTLDEHVTIGGPYFDVLQGTYTIEPTASGTVLHLESRLRVSTPFNLYAGPWADALMRSIQGQILRVIQRRCEAVGEGR